MSAAPVPSGRVKTLKIDGRDVSGTEEQTILEVARENGLEIPTMCQLDGLSNVGACRVCLVEVKGLSKLLPACVIRVEEGMEVATHSPRLDRYRRMIIEMMLSERNHTCAVCVSNGNCELQDAAQALGVNHVRVPYRYPRLEVDATHKQFAIDHNRCILCTRCVRVCDEVEGAHTWDIQGRGVDAMTITDLAQPWGESATCTSCGKCVQVCPTGAIVEKGKGVGEMEKRREFLPYLKLMREGEK